MIDKGCIEIIKMVIKQNEEVLQMNTHLIKHLSIPMLHVKIENINSMINIPGAAHIVEYKK